MHSRPRTIRAAGPRAARAVRGAGSFVAVLVTAGIVVFLLAGRDGGTLDGSPSPSPIPAAAAVSPELSANPPSDPATDAPSPSAAPATPTLEPTPQPTPSPTPQRPDPTPAPTKRPTAKPVVDPAPEPTPVVYRESGSFGSTLSAGGVTVSLDQHAPSSEPTCASDDPDVQGFSEVASFTLTIKWSKASEAMEPFVAVGSKPYFNVQWSDPGFHGSGTYVWSTCVRPGDTGPAIVSFEANGGAPRSYRFTFR